MFTPRTPGLPGTASSASLHCDTAASRQRASTARRHNPREASPEGNLYQQGELRGATPTKQLRSRHKSKFPWDSVIQSRLKVRIGAPTRPTRPWLASDASGTSSAPEGTVSRIPSQHVRRGQGGRRTRTEQAPSLKVAVSCTSCSNAKPWRGNIATKGLRADQATVRRRALWHVWRSRTLPAANGAAPKPQ